MLLAGCAGPSEPPYVFNEILVRNQTGLVLQQVRIRDIERNRVFECDNVAPRGICANRFRPRPYRANPIEISWKSGGKTRRSEAFVAEVPEFLDPAQPLRGVLVIDRGGAAQAFFEQGTSGLN